MTAKKPAAKGRATTKRRTPATKSPAKKSPELAILDDLVRNRPLRSALSRIFDFDLTGISVGRSTKLWFHLPQEWQATEVGADGSGGIFALCSRINREDSRLIYVSSEGQAGTVAGSIGEWLTLMAELPYWRDLLKFSKGGRVREMRRAAVHFERAMSREDPEALEWRTRLFEQLNIERPTDPIGVLHRNVTGGADLTVFAPEPCESLFGTFSVNDLR